MLKVKSSGCKVATSSYHQKIIFTAAQSTMRIYAKLIDVF